MKLVYFSNEFPYDDLQTLFLRQLPAALKTLVPPFKSILNFSDFADFRKGSLCGSQSGEEFDLGTISTALAGLGIGLLATVAVLLATTLADTPITGAQVLRQAFCLGVQVDEVVHLRSMEQLSSKFSPRIPIYSISTGKLLVASSATEIFENIIREIMTQVIQWDGVIQGVVLQTQDIGISKCEVVVFRISLPIHDLSAAFAKVPELDVSTKELIPWVHEKPTTEVDGPRGPMHSKIVIVGMSCRMPGGATDTEKFWELLENGMDVHRKLPADRFDVDSHTDPPDK
ncbi:hypothetical protein F5X96DRAFT_686334 [Biscogniauxia mediterranea]|nr:hypothetical protein F5X96DRAFT_686334 [Biscogniauxia mediterranea]